MKVSYKFLSQYVDLSDVTPEIVADKLTFAGAEVENVSPLAIGTNLVIGKIISCIPHPNSDHLHILQVDEGRFGVHQIVCGAPNAREGLKVIVARTGAKLAEVEIKPSTIRGVDSDGMCCSLLELGVNKKYLSEKQVNGIEELPDDAPVGEENVLGYLGLDDTILELSILPNRPDLYSLYNVAREVACLFSKEIKPLEFEKVTTKSTKLLVGSNTSKCPAFSGRIVRDVVTKPSPSWLVSILTACGIRSINNIVDIGNYVMLVTGQPLNMYDLDKLKDASLIVRDDIETSFLAMDGNHYDIVKGDLCVTNNGEIMCLAGIMTADACRVDENTKNIVVEAAYFDYASIRRTSNRIGLASDSSLRFAKGINPHIEQEVQEFTSALLVELAEAKIVEETSLYDSLNHDQLVIKLDKKYINNRLGTSFSDDLIKETLERDYFKVVDRILYYKVYCPLYRLDIEDDATLSEEVIRLLGYENVPSLLPETKLTVSGLTETQTKENMVKDYLIYTGLNEVLTYTLVSEKLDNYLAIVNKDEPYRLANPMSVDRAIVRRNLLSSLLEVASYNASRRMEDGAMFEVSDVDSKNVASRHLGILLFGKKHEQDLLLDRDYDFYDLKGYLSGILNILNIKENRISIVPTSEIKELHPYIAAYIKCGKDIIGVMGKLHPSEEKEFGVHNVLVMELDLAYLFNIKVGQVKAYIPSRFPSVSRDLAFVVDRDVEFGEIKKEILKLDSLIKDVSVFDVYQGEHIFPTKKSMAIRLILVSSDHTLTDAEINAVMDKVMGSIQSKFVAEIRK